MRKLEPQEVRQLTAIMPVGRRLGDGEFVVCLQVRIMVTDFH